MPLRNYQVDLINKTRMAFAASKRVLSVLPCGAGKTYCFADMCQKHINKNPNGYVWFLVHRQELIDQTINTFNFAGINHDNVLIAMVQTVAKHLENYTKPSLIIFDEAHHASASTWKKIIDKYSDIPMVGLTATPCRLDGRNLGDIFDKMIIGVNADYLIKNKYLCEYDYYAPNVDLETAKYQIKGNDYDLQDVEAKLNKSKIWGDIYKYININRKTIIYCPTIAFSRRLEREINERYINTPAVHFDGDTPTALRNTIVDKFRNGDIRILLNVNLVGEGFDVPDCDCCMLLRPTMSTSLYIQQATRCLRFKAGKKAVIYDFVGNIFKHGMPTDDHDWSLTTSIKIRNKTENNELLVRECKNCFRVYKGTSSQCPYCGYNNGKTKEQIKHDVDVELEKITIIEKKKQRQEVGRCQNFDGLVEIGKKRGYKNPAYWANAILKARRKL